MSRAFLCLCLIIPTLFFASCESYEDPQNEVLKGYFEESKGLFQASTDSISRFSAKVNEFTTRIPEAKNDPLYTQIHTLKQVANWFVWLASTLGRFNANELRRADHEVHDIADGRYDGRIQKFQQGISR